MAVDVYAHYGTPNTLSCADPADTNATYGGHSGDLRAEQQPPRRRECVHE